MIRKPMIRQKRPAWRRRVGIAVLLLAALAAIATHAPALHLLGSHTYRTFPAAGGKAPVAAVFLSGDMGFDFGMSGAVSKGLAAHGIPVVGVVSPVAFAHHQTRAQAQAVVTDAIGRALRQTGAQRIILMGGSFGADIVATVAPDLPADLRARIAAIGLTVPGRDVYFRADPSGLAYLGTPEARPAAALRQLGWAPVVCIYGVEESDSLCPLLKGSAAQVIGLPGGHYLRHDPARLTATVLRALHAAGPATGV